MKIVVPCTKDAMRDEAIDAVALHAHRAGIVPLLHDVSGSDIAYCELLAMLWADGEDFAIVEHDVVPHERVFTEFLECPEPYCAFPYAWSVCVGPALGCTRFRAELLERIPDAIERVARRPSNWGVPGHWRQVDVFLMRWILRDLHGRQPHVHLPPVEHLNEAKQLLPWADPEPVLEVRGWA